MTLSLSDAAERVWDVAVVGAGPAGGLAALELARHSQAVLLIDKAVFPRTKVCGSCLNGHALAVLREAGLSDLPRRLGGVALRRFCLAGRGRRAVLALPAGVAVSRAAFDDALVQRAIDAGAAFLPRTQAVLSHGAGGAQHLQLHQPDQSAGIRARIVVAAGGLGGSLLAPHNAEVVPASRIGVGLVLPDGPADYAPGTIYMACGSHGYAGIVRLEGGQLDLAAALEPATVAETGGPGHAVRLLLQEVGLPVPDLAASAWRGTPPLTRRAAQVAGNRLFVIGDAAGYVEPFTGEGIGWALASARAVVPLVRRGLRRWEPSLAQAWNHYQDRSGRDRCLCRALALLLRRPWWTRGLIGTLSLLPGLATPLVRYLNRGPAPLAELSYEPHDPGFGDRLAGKRRFADAGRGDRPLPWLPARGAERRPGQAVPPGRD